MDPRASQGTLILSSETRTSDTEPTDKILSRWIFYHYQSGVAGWSGVLLDAVVRGRRSTIRRGEAQRGGW
jgi:hypothetical protein